MSTTGISMNGGLSHAMVLDGDPAAELAALALDQSVDQRRIAQTDREAAEASEIAEDAAQISALHEKADEIHDEATSQLVAGLASGVGQIAGGVVSFSGACTSKVEGGVETTRWTKEASGVAAAIEGSHKVVATVADIEVTQAKSREADLDADATAHEKAAALARARVDDARELRQDAGDAARKALDWYGDYSSARSQATTAALHRA